MKKIIPVLFCIISLAANAVTTRDTLKKGLIAIPDSVKQNGPLQFAIPGVLIVYGVSSFVIKPVRNFDYFIRAEIKKNDPGFRTNAESYFQFAPAAMVYGLNLIGAEGKNDFIDRTVLLGLSAGILGISVYSTKYITYRLRPDKSHLSSFPSGHTANAFMEAGFLAQEYSERSLVYTLVGYSIAVTTAVFRLYNRDHSFSEVIAGAGYGMLSTKAAYLIYPYIRSKFSHTDKKGRNSIILPTYQNGLPGLSFAMQL